MPRGSHIVKFEKVVGAKRTNDAHFIIIVGTHKLSKTKNEKDPGCGSATRLCVCVERDGKCNQG